MRSERRHDEADLVEHLRKEVNASRAALLWRNNTGLFCRIGAPRIKVRCGLGTGSADLVGILVGSGRGLAIECKSPTGRLDPAQVCWRDVWIASGGLYVLARSADVVLAAICPDPWILTRPPGAE